MSILGNLSWAKKRQLKFLLGFFVLILIVGAYPTYSLFHKPATCFDLKKNGSELGIDCGGGCLNVCTDTVKSLSVEWGGFFQIDENLYDFAAILQNKNADAAIKKLDYQFIARDSIGRVLVERSGQTFVNPSESIVIFEPGIGIIGESPTKVDFSFSAPAWEKAELVESPFRIKNKELLNPDNNPELLATIENSGIESKRNLDVFSIIYGAGKEVVAVSSTFIADLGAGQEKQVRFTWPSYISEFPRGAICTEPVDAILVFDRSGSMNDDGLDPPQPITDAKNAASVFVENLKETDQVGFVSFATTPSDPIDKILSPGIEETVETIQSTKILGNDDNTQHTNLGHAIEEAIKELGSSRHREGVKKVVVALTDGIVTRPKNEKGEVDLKYASEYAKTQATHAREDGTLLYTIGLGANVEEDYLRDEIASTPEHYYGAATAEELRGIYSQIAEEICKAEPFITEVMVREEKRQGL